MASLDPKDFSLHSVEYTKAYLQMTREVIDRYAKLNSPLENVGFYQTEHSGPTIYPDAPEPLEQEMQAVETAVKVQVDFRSGTIENHTELLVNLAESARSNLIHHFTGRFEQVSKAHSRRLNAGGGPITWELLLQALDAIPLSFDEEERLIPPNFMGPPEIQQQIERLFHLGPPMNLQKQYEEMLKLKRQENNARNHPRRLSRQPSE